DSVGWTSFKVQFSTKGAGLAAYTVDKYMTSSKCELFVYTSHSAWATVSPLFWTVNWYFSVSPMRDWDAGASSFNLICDATKIAIAAASADRMFPFRSV